MRIAHDGQQAGHQAIYLSGAGGGECLLRFTDLGMTSLNDVLIDVNSKLQCSDFTLWLVDKATGPGAGRLTIARNR